MGFVVCKKSRHGAQIAAGAEHVEHAMPLTLQPAIEPAAPLHRAPQQGAIKVGHQYQLGIGGEFPGQVVAEGTPIGCRHLFTTLATRASWRSPCKSGGLRLQGLARFFARNRRDGARLLSTALVITGAGLVRIDHPIGRGIALVGGLVSLYWWLCYRQLER